MCGSISEYTVAPEARYGIKASGVHFSQLNLENNFVARPEHEYDFQETSQDRRVPSS
jgi:hypothetical protein